MEKYLYATSQLSQTTLRSVCGQAELDELLAEREKINAHLQEILDKDTEPWGVKVAKVEIKNIDLPQEMQRAIAKQAEAERERRAKVIGAEGEFQAAQNFPTRPRSSARTRSPCSCATSRRWGRWPPRTLDDHLPGPDRPVDSLHADLEGHEKHIPPAGGSPAGGRVRPRPARAETLEVFRCTRTMTFSPTPIRKHKCNVR